ncbi:unnamed protein product [marine sediment metagenome]|uniref:Uncharacterized protein n=1 Tax=marine sediment metagenome TaxID=412755 RepID=X0WMD0_9ZZZZ
MTTPRAQKRIALRHAQRLIASHADEAGLIRLRWLCFFGQRFGWHSHVDWAAVEAHLENAA